MVTPFISYNCLIHEDFAYQQFLPLMKSKKETWKKNGWAKKNVHSTVEVPFLTIIQGLTN